MTGIIYPLNEKDKFAPDLEPTTKEQLLVYNLEENDFVKKSLGFIPQTSFIRRKLIRLVSPQSWFNSFILSMILFNSISMAIIDYRFIDNEYNPRSDVSLRNYVVEILEIFFTVIFILEFFFKVIAHGFFFGDRTYLKDHWNKLDFIVVLASVLVMVPAIPNISVIRTVRVLRPLRSVSKLPGLRKIIGALVDSLPDLANVIFLLLLILMSFSIMGVLLWRGLLHGRCRLTPFPVLMSDTCRMETEPCWKYFISNVTENPYAYKCIQEANDNSSWTKSTSPWFSEGPFDCFWPIDQNDERVCSLYGNGMHNCPSLMKDEDYVVERTCGSNYDQLGNPRFWDTLEPFGYNRMKSGTFVESLNWGYSNFDNFLYAFVTSFQIITFEGWSDIMYQTMDSWYVGPTIATFFSLIMLGGNIALNLVLAVIDNSLDKLDKDDQGKYSPKEASDGGKSMTPVLSSTFSKCVMCCILINTLILGLDHYSISLKMSRTLEIFNLCLSFIFFIEMGVTLYIIGIQRYISDPFYCFDGLTVIISIIEIILASLTSAPTGFSIFRSLRLFRVFKMARNWKSLNSLLGKMYKSVLEIGNFGILLVLFIHIYALIGMQLFANRMHFHAETGAHIPISDPSYNTSEIPRTNFDNFASSLTAVFQILTGENWNTVMYDGWRATSWFAVVYFLTLVIFGVFIVMKLFLAILLKNFEEHDDLVNKTCKTAPSEIFIVPIDVSSSCKANIKPMTNDSNSYANDYHSSTTIEEEVKISSKYKRSISLLRMKLSRIVEHQMYKRSIYFLRMKLSIIVEHHKFNKCITVLIVMSSVCLAIENPLIDPEFWYMKLLTALNIFFVVLFTIEVTAKMFVYGIISSSHAYFRSTWNVLDFVAVTVSILDLANVGPGNALRVLRVFRVLRPLRMISRFPQLKVVVDALLMSLPAVGNVAIICTLFFFIFAVFGVNYLKGTFYWCSGNNFNLLSLEEQMLITNPIAWGSLSLEQASWFNANSTGCSINDWDPYIIPTSKQFCECLTPGDWIEVIPQNFNNVFNGMALLFEISTTEGWVDVMFAAIDQRGVDAQPKRDQNFAWAIFFVLFLLICSFFVLELFVGVIIENFNKIRDSNGRGLMTDGQKEWASTQAFVMKIKPLKKAKRPKGKIREWCNNIVSNPKFDSFIIVCIIANTACMTLVNFGESQEEVEFFKISNLLFTIIFAIEFVFKFTAYGRKYFREGWNKFDFVVVCGTIVGLGVDSAVSENSPLTSVILLLRIGRILRLIKSVKRLRVLLNTMITSVPSILNIGAILTLLFFVYAVCGVQLYSAIAYNEYSNVHANFRSFENAMSLLLRFSTGEGWNSFMHGMMMKNSNEECDPEPVNDFNIPWCIEEDDFPDCKEINGCGGGVSLYIYFYTFVLIVGFVIMNLFVGVILDAFNNSSESDILSPTDLAHFTKIWAEFDPDATWYISTDDVKKFLSKLAPPLGLGTNYIDIKKWDRDLLDIPIRDDGMVNIVNVATQLAKRLAKQKLGSGFSELSDDHPLQQKMMSQSIGMNQTMADITMYRAIRKLKFIRTLAGTMSKVNIHSDISIEHSITTEDLKLTGTNITVKSQPLIPIEEDPKVEFHSNDGSKSVYDSMIPKEALQVTSNKEINQSNGGEIQAVKILSTTLGVEHGSKSVYDSTIPKEALQVTSNKEINQSKEGEIHAGKIHSTTLGIEHKDKESKVYKKEDIDISNVSVTSNGTHSKTPGHI